ncbi:MAG: ATP-binding cassette domain-containing protein [Ruminococcaceae bacterium]|nr:ATP-binding cassette domain-containing protein [Oscillospiraceae bacterium]
MDNQMKKKNARNTAEPSSPEWRICSNRPLPRELTAIVSEALEIGEEPLFAVVCDLTTNARYGDSLLLATNRRIIAVERGELVSAPYAEIQSVRVKRMYGNASLLLTPKNGGVKRILRFSYAVGDLCEMASQFVNAVASGSPLSEEMEIVRATYDKLNLVCPKCGRNLIRAGADCIHCRAKSQVAAKLLRYVRPELKTILICILISCVTTAISLLPPYMTQTIVDEVLPLRELGLAPDGIRRLTFLVVFLLCAYVVQFSLSALRGYLSRRTSDRMVLSLRNDVYEKAQHLPMKFYDKTSTGAVINRISGDTNTIQAFIIRITQDCLIQFALMVGIITVMLCMNWRLTLLSLIPVPLVVIGSRIFSKRIAPYYKKIWRRWASVTSIMTDTIPCVRVIKAFAGEKRAREKFTRYSNEWYRVDMASAKITQTFPWIISFAVTCGSLLIWAVGGRWALLGQVTAGTLVSFISYASMFYNPVNFFANLSDSYQAALASVERVFDILDAECEQSNENGLKPQYLKGKIEFRQVNFSFDKTKKTLSDINVTINPGDIVGIVGTTGSGKSTLINLLMRFYDHYEGDILVDGHNIKDINLEAFRSCIGYVQQEPMMFSDTIFNNIAYGAPNASVEEVIHAAEVANAHSFIVRQPDGYDSMLGERGVGLSGGEKQRLSIARAVLKNPSILVFDEATAAVDSETESLIQEAIERLISGRTTLMIAHRLSTLRKANLILVMDKGRIIEAGSHEELMELGGKYKKLIDIQSMGNQRGELTVPS